MGLDGRGLRRCDECGKPMRNATRIHEGHEYCQSCHKRVFVAVECTQCQSPMRGHRHAQVPYVCSNCERAVRTCLRCGKPLPLASLRVAHGAVCSSCARHVLEPTPCERCGVLSKRLSRSLAQGITIRVCDRCRNQATHKTCSHCGRYRAVAAQLPDGKARCANCLPGEETSHACPDCQAVMSGPGHSRCRHCQIASQVRASLALTSVAMVFPWGREMVDRFCQWYIADGSLAPLALRRLPHYEAFFQRLETAGGREGAPSASTLLAHFRVEELHRYKVPMRFLRDVQGLALDAKAKVEHAERTRIQDLLASSRQASWFTLLKQYVAWLEGRGKLARTIRLYASAAQAVCKSLELSLDVPPDGAPFERYLRYHRGQRTNLSVFVSYCRRELGWEVSMPTLTSSSAPAPVHPVLQELDVLLERVRRGAGDQQAQLERAVSLLLGFDDLRLSEVQWTIGRRSGRPLAFMRGTETVQLPKAVGDLAAQWLRHGAPPDLLPPKLPDGSPDSAPRRQKRKVG